MPVPLVALVLTTSVSPPHSLGSRCSRQAACTKRSTFRPGRSILFSATTIGTSAARAWLMASSVCGMTPSSAATTSTAMSVTLAPRARISVNASWPGVSTKVTAPPFGLHFVGADVLGDAAFFVGSHVEADDPVQKRRFAVIDVAQHRDDRRPRPQRFGFVGQLGCFQHFLLQRNLSPQLDLEAQFDGQQFRRLGVDVRSNVGHRAATLVQGH